MGSEALINAAQSPAWRQLEHNPAWISCSRRAKAASWDSSTFKAVALFILDVPVAIVDSFFFLQTSVVVV
jgi:hypothetical protein